MTSSKSTQQKAALTRNIFSIFTNAVGGDPSELTDTLHNRYTVDDFAYHDEMYYWGVFGYFEKTVIPHKIAVYQEGFELTKKEWFNKYLTASETEQFIENLWLHDLSKFSANEAFGYACYDRATGNGKDAFERAWHHHKMNNPHHPEYWFNPDRSGKNEPIAMPMIYVMEMVADWLGASRTYGTPLNEWLPDNLHKFRFGALKSTVMNILGELGIRTWIHEGNILKTVE